MRGRKARIFVDVFNEYVRIAASCPNDPCGSRALTSLSEWLSGDSLRSLLVVMLAFDHVTRLR